MASQAEEDFRSYMVKAKTGDKFAQYSVAWAYKRGSGVPKDYVAALAWYKKVAEHGYEVDLIEVGKIYEYGTLCLADPAEAFRWYTKAAKKGRAAAQIKLSMCYRQGIGVPKDDKMAFAWMKKAAFSSKHSGPYFLGTALGCLGHFYENEIGVSEDLSAAVYCYERGAMLDCVMAQASLAFCYEEGVGLPINLVKAYAWYIVSRRYIDPLFLKKLTPSQITSGKNKAKVFKKLVDATRLKSEREQTV
jgi:TPR repeat protein